MTEEFIAVRWSVVAPCNHEVILKEATYHDHVNGDHTVADADFRMQLEKYVKTTIENPRYIVADALNDCRCHFIDIVPVTTSSGESLRFLKVIVDVSLFPHEVVTWLPERKKVSTQGGIIYDKNRGFIKQQQI